MTLIEMISGYPKRLSAPLAGYPGCKLSKTEILDNLQDANTQFKSLSMLIEKCHPDIVFPFMDLSVEAEALGLKIRYNVNGAPDVLEHPIKNQDQLSDFSIPDPLTHGRLKVFIDVISMLKQQTDGLVSGCAIGPFTLAGLLMGGDNLAMASILKPELCKTVLDFTTKAVIPYAKLQEQNGADIITLLEPTAVIMSPELFEQFIGPYIDIVCNEIDAPIILHICGNTNNLIPSICKTQVQGLSLDTAVDLAKIAKIVPPSLVLMGNIDPINVMTSKNENIVRQNVKELLKSMEGIPNFILSTGCDIPYNAPVENISALCEETRNF